MLGTTRRAALLACLAALATVAVLVTTRSQLSATVLATAAELREITWAERSDMKPSNLAAKNDDGHTKIWDAADSGDSAKLFQSGSPHPDHHRAAAVSDRGRNFFGAPKFFAHSTGYVQDYSSARDSFGLPERKAVATQLLQLPAMGPMSAAAKAKALDMVDAWETKELRKTFADPERSQEAVKAAEAATWAKHATTVKTKARTQKLFNAAANDEITAKSIGHMHPSEMEELRKLAPEYKELEKGHHVTTATKMHFEPLRWMHEQGEPGAVKTRKAVLKSPARFTQLWNAAADDEDGDAIFNPRQWLASQHDDSEMREMAPLPAPGRKRMFREDADHERNFEGSYVADNHIGLQVDSMKAPTQMLASKGEVLQMEQRAAVRAAYLAKHPRQAGRAQQAAAHAKADGAKAAHASESLKADAVLVAMEHQEAAGIHALSDIDSMSAAHPLEKQAGDAYLAKHPRAAKRAGKEAEMKSGKNEESEVKAEVKAEPVKSNKKSVPVKSEKKVEPVKSEKKAVPLTSLEGEEGEGEGEGEGEAVEDENAEIIKELEELRAMAMDAVGNLPESAPESVRAIAKGDYEALLAYLDQVRFRVPNPKPTWFRTLNPKHLTSSP
jgi:hypothetical protein